MTATDLAQTIAARLEALDPVHLELDDQSEAHAGHAGAAGGARHFSLTVVSQAFSGAGRLARHRAVLDRLSDLIPFPVHALAIRACTPDEYFSSLERTPR